MTITNTTPTRAAYEIPKPQEQQIGFGAGHVKLRVISHADVNETIASLGSFLSSVRQTRSKRSAMVAKRTLTEAEGELKQPATTGLKKHTKLQNVYGGFSKTAQTGFGETTPTNQRKIAHFDAPNSSMHGQRVESTILDLSVKTQPTSNVVQSDNQIGIEVDINRNLAPIEMNTSHATASSNIGMTKPFSEHQQKAKHEIQEEVGIFVGKQTQSRYAISIQRLSDNSITIKISTSEPLTEAQKNALSTDVLSALKKRQMQCPSLVYETLLKGAQ
jgi:hypothetical protein